ncbi:PE family protein [Mycobacterium bourgelatii]|uniref:PE domain-containing protein n=1 Tax=Mycobacterium bourgelatii TaxID=1273442 RepID=A0A7I9YZJ0_MYCBU|nr:PE family protein [Mycobacterium bourgelatii]MCV6976632.1 PE family protein [Mycobacterium bourgelatii]GFG94081.1 hypothetical protein MBOU_61230 [Mycobacterium bourgelatii]
MPYVIASPDSMTAAAAQLMSIGSTLEDVHRLAFPSILAVAPAAADEVSAGIAQLLSKHGQDYQLMAKDAAIYQEGFVQNLRANAEAYAGIEELIAYLMQGLNAELSYYDTARMALGQVLTLSALQVLAFTLIPFFWPLAPLAPFLILNQPLTFVFDVLFRQPITYPYMVKY